LPRGKCLARKRFRFYQTLKVLPRGNRVLLRDRDFVEK
jgi:hypothetical protein